MAKITSIIPTGQWRELYKFDVTLDTGDKGTVFGKTPQLRFGIGDEVAHSINEKGTMKLDKPQYGGGAPSYSGGGSQSAPAQTGSKDELIVRQVAIKAAVELAASHGLDMNAMFKAAEEINAWILNKPGRTHQEHFEDDPF
jgi:hypothetical protein